MQYYYFTKKKYVYLIVQVVRRTCLPTKKEGSKTDFIFLNSLCFLIVVRLRWVHYLELEF